MGSQPEQHQRIRRRASHRRRVREQPRHRRLRTRHALPPRRNRTRQLIQMHPLVIVEVERPRERLDGRVTRIQRLPLLERSATLTSFRSVRVQIVCRAGSPPI